MNRTPLVVGAVLAVLIGIPLLLGALGVSGYDTGYAIGSSLVWVIENPWIIGLGFVALVLVFMLRGVTKRR